MAYKDPKTFERQVVPLCELVPMDGHTLEGFTFTECQVYGPAILMFEGPHTVISNNTYGPTLDAALWEIPPSRTMVTGAILAVNCTFSGCTFERVGFAGSPEFIQRMRAGTSA